MKVEILNPESLKNIFLTHGLFACECYDTPEKYAERVGKACQDSGHYSGSRTEYIKFKVSGVDRGTSEQVLRSEIGARNENMEDVVYMEKNIDLNPTTIVKNMKSFRYVDMSNFEYTIPEAIKNSEKATIMFQTAIEDINQSMKNILKELSKENNNDKEILEATQFLLPRATNTSFVIGFTIEALIKYMWKRLCVRTQPEHRKLAKKIMELVVEIQPEYKEKLVPHCKHLLWCPEGKMTCGAYPTRNELLLRLK